MVYTKQELEIQVTKLNLCDVDIESVTQKMILLQQEMDPILLIQEEERELK